MPDNRPRLNIILRAAIEKLASLKYPEAILEAEILSAHALKKTRSFVLAHPEYRLNASENKKLNALLKRRLAGEPLAYVLGHQEFFGLDFHVDRRVLIPRPETELMVEEILKLPTNAGRIYLDLGTGSGCIIISLAANIKIQSLFISLDASAQALAVAKKNAKLNEVADKIIFIKSDLLSAIIKNKKILAKADELIIAANLPYVPTGYLAKLNRPETIPLGFEPWSALEGGADGLDLYRRLADQLARLKALRPDLKIKVYAEIQPGQADEMRKIFGKSTQVMKDYCAKDRLIIV